MKRLRTSIKKTPAETGVNSPKGEKDLNMTLFRAVHDKHNPYVMLNTTIVKDARVSWKAKGLWLYAFSRPNDWSFNLKDLINNADDGRDSVRSGLNELEKAGYLHRRHGRDEETQQYNGIIWCFFETPRSPAEIQKKLPETDFPSTAFPAPANRPLLSNESNQVLREATTATECPSLSEPTVEESLPDTGVEVAAFLSYWEKCHKTLPVPKDVENGTVFKEIIERHRVTSKKIAQTLAWISDHNFWPDRIFQAKHLLKSWARIQEDIQKEAQRNSREAQKNDPLFQEKERVTANIVIIRKALNEEPSLASHCSFNIANRMMEISNGKRSECVDLTISIPKLEMEVNSKLKFVGLSYQLKLQ